MQRVVILISLFLAPIVLAGDAKIGKEKSVICASCHGANGISVNPVWPNLAGQHEQYTARQLALFKKSERKDAVMAGMVAGLSSKDMKNIASYYASQKSPIGSANESTLEIGQAVYQAGNAKMKTPACMACHGIAGKGNPLSGYPILAGQHAAYTEKRLKDFRAGEKTADDKDVNGKVMADVAKYLTDEEIKAVANYIQGLYSE